MSLEYERVDPHTKKWQNDRHDSTNLSNYVKNLVSDSDVGVLVTGQNKVPVLQHLSRIIAYMVLARFFKDAVF